MGSGVLIDTAIRLLAALALVVANAGFVAAEFALVAVDRARIDERAGQGQARAAAVQRLLSRLSYHLSGAQLGITITSLLLGVLAEPAVARVLEPGIEAAFGEVPTGVSVAIALAVATVVQMIFGELIPKAIATTDPSKPRWPWLGPPSSTAWSPDPSSRCSTGWRLGLPDASGSSRPRSSRWFPTAENSST